MKNLDGDDDFETSSSEIGMIKNLSKDDLRFEIKRWQQKCDVLSRDKKILEDERSISSTKAIDSTVIENLSEELRNKNAQLLKSQEITGLLLQKHRVVLRHLWLEKRNLLDIKSEMNTASKALFSNSEIFKSVEAIKAEYEVCINREELSKKSLAFLSKRFSAQQINMRQVLSSVRELKTEWVELKKSFCHNNANETVEIFKNLKSAVIQKFQGYMSEKNIQETNMKKVLSSNNIELLRLQTKLTECEAEILREADKIAVSITAKENLEGDINKLREKLSEKEKLISNLSDENLKISDALKVSTDRLNITKDQLSRLATIHDAVQADFTVVLNREEALRQELANSGNHKDDIANRLKRIQEKVNRMESDHAVQLASISQESKQWEQAYEKLGIEHEASFKEIKSQLYKECDEWKSKAAMLEEQMQIQIVNERGHKLKIVELSNIISELKANLGETEIFRDESSREISILRSELSNFKNKTISMSSENEQNLKTLHDLQSALELSRRYENEKDALIASNANEISRLNGVIRRECEERTELIIQISELKDCLRDKTIMNSKYLNNSTKSSIYGQSSVNDSLTFDKIQNESSNTSNSIMGQQRKLTPLSDALEYGRTLVLPEQSHTLEHRSDNNSDVIGTNNISQLRDSENDNDAQWANRMARQGAGSVTKGRRPHKGFH